MRKVLILGSLGMAGHVIADYLGQQSRYEVIRCARRPITPEIIALDVTEFDKIEDVVQSTRPDFVINCVGMLVEASQARIDLAILTNSYLPHFLVSLGRVYGYRLIHISTDCVFSGDRGGYSENDFRDGDTAYARTKALGEIINNVDLTLRTSIIGPELKPDGSGLLHWFLTQKGEVKGYANAYWSGVTTLELAKVIHRCLVEDASGLVNLAMGKKISKFDLLVECQKVWCHGQVRIVVDKTYKTDKSLVSNRTDLPFNLPTSYHAMLAELKVFMQHHSKWYPHYSLCPSALI